MRPIHHHPNLKPVLKDKLLQLSREFFLVAIYHAPPTTGTISHLLIVAQFRKQVETILERKWVRNSPEQHGVHILGVYDHQLHYHQKKGNPWVRFLCHSSFKIYEQKEYDTCYDTAWDKGKKKRKAYTHAFHHDRDLLRSQAEQWQELPATPAAFLAYEALFEHHISHLESLYMITHYVMDTLHARIQRLFTYCPELEALFVRYNGNQLLLPRQFDQAKKEDPFEVNVELLPSIQQTEEALYQKVIQRLDELKQAMKSKSPIQAATPPLCPEPPSETSQCIAMILKKTSVEEIYRFHQTYMHQGRVDYLLLVGEGLGTERLESISESVSATLESTHKLVLIGHSRKWIQKNLYQNQDFFKKAMAPDNRIYQSHPHHPQPHWEEPYESNHPDMDLWSQWSLEMAHSFRTLRNSETRDSLEGLDLLFSAAVLRLLRVLVYATSSYLPNYLSARTLWYLVLFGAPELQHLVFLFEKLDGQNFFKQMDVRVQCHHHSRRLSETELALMEEILDILSKKLSEAIARCAQ